VATRRTFIGTSSIIDFRCFIDIKRQADYNLPVISRLCLIRMGFVSRLPFGSFQFFVVLKYNDRLAFPVAGVIGKEKLRRQSLVHSGVLMCSSYGFCI
jgi:hypothetical protein